MRAAGLLQNVVNADAVLTVETVRAYPDLSLRQQRTGLAAGKDPRRTTTAVARFFCVRTLRTDFNGRALVGERSRSPVLRGRRSANPALCPATPFSSGSRVSQPVPEAAMRATVPARPEQTQNPIQIEIIQRALRAAAFARSDVDALDIAGEALRQLAELARAANHAEVSHG
jgi:hypothetical protein